MISKAALFFSLIIAFNPFYNPGSEDFEWKLQKNKSGIKVYTSDVKGSSLKAFKAEMNLEANSFDNILAPIFDIENYDELIPNCRDSKILAKKGDWYYKYYSISSAPWPVSDRDGVYEQKAKYIKEENSVQIDITCLNGEVEKKDGIVRMTIGKGYWKIHKMDITRFQVIYVYHAEPSGSIPAWLANSSVVDIPMKLFRNLRNNIQKPEYENAKFSFTPEE